MQPGKRRIAMLKRVARLREVEKRQAALKLAQAQGMHGKLAALRDRSGEIAASYSARRDAGDGSELARQLQFTASIEALRGHTASETHKAEQSSHAAMAHLRVAERRHEITGETLAAQQREEEMRLAARDAAQLARKLKRQS
jgi:hypothetical protein